MDEKGEFLIEIVAPEKEEIGIVAVEMPDGATAFERIKLRSADTAEPQKYSVETVEKIKNAKTSPLVENGKAILFYRGAAKKVMIAGDMTGWNPQRLPMRKVGENLFAATLDLAANARAEYKFVVDGKWIGDDLNPNKLDNGVGGENSVLTMPDYKQTVWDKKTIRNDVLPTIQELEIDSKIYGKRKVSIYLPLRNSKNLPTLYLLDGKDYWVRAQAIIQHDNLVNAGKIQPFNIVFIDYQDRMKEYWASDDFARFLATEVVPAVDAKYNTIKTRDGRAVLGASLGGVSSVWVGLKYPEVFSRIGGQSSSFWIDNGRVVKELAKLDANKTKYRFYFDTGTLEGVDNSRRVNAMLRGKGYPVTYAEGETGHNWTSWRDRLADAFVA